MQVKHPVAALTRPRSPTERPIRNGVASSRSSVDGAKLSSSNPELPPLTPKFAARDDDGDRSCAFVASDSKSFNRS